MNPSPAAQPTRAPGRRRTRRGLVGALAAATVLVVGGGSAPSLGTGSAPADAEARAAAPGGTALLFTYDGRGGLREGARVRNTAGKGRGIVRVAEGGRMAKVKGKPRRAARFPRSGFGMIEAADRRAWDPRRRDFSYGTKVKVSRAEVVRHSNLVQKGYYRQPGGQWKLQLDRGLPSCVVNGDAGRLRVRSATSIADGAWHRLQCRRTSAGPGAARRRRGRRVRGRVHRPRRQRRRGEGGGQEAGAGPRRPVPRPARHDFPQDRLSRRAAHMVAAVGRPRGGPYP